jgi:DNA-binding transcriptional LysR family regulator
VQQGSFSQAAEILGVSKSFVSKHISQLEKDLKARLLNRTTRQLSLTEAGEIFYQHCQSLSTVAEHGYEAMVNLRKQPSGNLKISAPPTLAIYLLGKIFSEYSQCYPEVKFNVVLESRIIDIVQQGFDLALRSASLPDSTLVSQRIGTLRYVLCASPAYLKKHGVIKYPEQLTQHIFATYSGSKSAKQLVFTRGNQQYKVNITSHFQSNNLDLMAQMATAGSCIAVLPEFMTKTLVAKKQLVICLPEFKLPEMPLYVVYPERDLVPLKVKTFIEFLKTHLAKI